MDCQLKRKAQAVSHEHCFTMRAIHWLSGQSSLTAQAQWNWIPKKTPHGVMLHSKQKLVCTRKRHASQKNAEL